MKNKSISACSGTRGSTKFTILSYAISILLAFSSSIAVCAKAPRTAKIAFMSKRDGNSEIYSMNPDGSEQVNLTQHPAEDYDPAWSPNGKQILFSSNRDGTFDLYLMEADGTNVRKVFKNSKYRRNPVWSPDGKRVVYEQGTPQKVKQIVGLFLIPRADLTIYIATLNGDSVEKLADGFDPNWSPDGREIAFAVGGREGTPLGIFDLQKRSQKTILSKENPWINSPTWSPRGDKIVFAKLDGVSFDGQGFLFSNKSMLYIVNRDGTGLHQITKDEGKRYSSPTWSPHGNELAYTAFGGGSIQIFKMDLDGRNATQLTYLGRSNSRPDWFDPFYSVSPSAQSLRTMWGKIKTDSSDKEIQK